MSEFTHAYVHFRLTIAGKVKGKNKEMRSREKHLKGEVKRINKKY